MSQEVIEILKSQIPLFEKMRRSAMLTYAMRGTGTKKKLLNYVLEVQQTAWQIIQINEHTISVLEAKLKEKNHEPASQANPTAASEGESPVGTGSREEQAAAISKALGTGVPGGLAKAALNASDQGAQLIGRGSVEVNSATSGTVG